MIDSARKVLRKSNIYYLQQMGVDVWRLRNMQQKILVLIKIKDILLLTRTLLDNILLSINVNPGNFELRYINENNLENLDLNIYKTCIIMSDDKLFDKSDLKLNIPVIKTFDLNYLLINPLAKRDLYKALSF